MRPAPIAIYSRKSRFTGQGESIENQIELCRKYCFLHYEGLREEDLIIYEDEGYSGGNTRRPQFLAMMEDARRRRFNAIVCYRLDRVSRNIGDFARLIEELGGLSIAFVSIKEQFDTSSPLGRAMMYIASVFSQLERETIAERIRDNMLELSRTGRWLGGVTPTGFASQAVEYRGTDGKIRRLCRLTPVPEEINLVKAVFCRYLSCGSLTLLEERLAREGLTSRRGRTLRRDALRQMLGNPVYAAADVDTYRYFASLGAQLSGEPEDFDGKRGLMVYNKTRQAKWESSRTRPRQDWVVAPGEHPAVLSGAQWVGVQRLLSSPPRGRPSAAREEEPPLLTGLLFCGGCGGALRAKKTGRRDRGGHPVFYYLCREKELRGGCQVKNAPGGALDTAVSQWMENIREDRETLVRMLEDSLIKARAQLDAQGFPRPGECHPIEAPGVPARPPLERVRAAASASASPGRCQGRDGLPGTMAAASHAASSTEAATPAGGAAAVPPAPVSGRKDTGYPSSFASWWEGLSFWERRQALAALFTRAQWDGERLTLFPHASLLPPGGDSK